MTKQIIVLKANGESYTLPKPPTLEEMQKIVGGYIEHVRVLDRIENKNLILTSMYINEEGLLEDLPRNVKATELYQRLTRAQFPHAKNPFAIAQEAMKAQYEKDGFKFIEMPEPVEGYNNDPYIVGDVIFFEGYTCEETDAVLNGESDAA